MTGKEDGQIFVGGLSWCTTERMLELAFRRFGKIIDTQVITERHTGRSRGFGFVTFSDPRVATSAIACMHNQVLDGQAISVLKAYPKHNAGRDTAYGGRDGHCAPRYGRWERDCLNAGVARRSGRLIFSEFSSPFMAISPSGVKEAAVSQENDMMPMMDASTTGAVAVTSAEIAAATDQAVQIGVAMTRIVSEGEAATGAGHRIAVAGVRRGGVGGDTGAPRGRGAALEAMAGRSLR